jgi:RNA polymerase sigma-70 factor (ECF subfamily)
MNISVMTDDCTDLSAVRTGDFDAFGRIHDRHARLLLSICRRHGPGGPGGSLAEAEDSTQEVFIRAYQRLDRVEDCTKLGAWLAGIASNVAREKRRSMARRLKHEGELMKRSAGKEGVIATAETEAMRQERFQGLEVALDTLADDERLAIHIHYLEHDPVGVAATVLGLSKSGYYKLLARARGRLADMLSSHEEEITQ